MTIYLKKKSHLWYGMETNAICLFIKEHKQGIFLFLIVLLGIFLRIIYFQGIVHDEIMNIIGAMNILANQYDPLNDHLIPAVRYVFISIVTLFVFIFGPTHYAVVPIPFLFTIGTIILLYFIGKKLWNERIGYIAAFLLTILPLHIKYASILETDVVITFLMAICFLLYLSKKSMWSYGCIGIILGLGSFIKIFIMLLFPVLFFDLLLKKEIKPIFIISCAALMAVLPFLLWQYSFSNNFLYHLSVEQNLDEFWAYRIRVGQNDYSFFQYIFNPFSTLPEPSLFHVYPILVFVYFWYNLWNWHSLLKKEYIEHLLWFWLIAGFLILEYTPIIPKDQRYLMIIAIPLILLVSFLIDRIKNYKIILCLLLIFLGFTFFQLGKHTLFNPKFHVDGHAIYSEEHGMYELVLKYFHEKDIYVVHYSQIPQLTYYFKFSKNYSGVAGYKGPTKTSFYDLHYTDNLEEIHDSFVIADFRFMTSEADWWGYYQRTNGSEASIERLRKGDIPQTWKWVYSVLALDGSNLIIVYYIPPSGKSDISLNYFMTDEGIKKFLGL